MSDNNYSLKNMDFFNKHLNADTNKIIQLYSELIIQYFKFITENKNITPKNKNLLSFIITRGLETITYVFSFLLYYTKNVDVAYFHSQKSFYFYVEFIGQISEDENMFLQLSSRDAALYVYKKTIFELNSNSDTKNKVIILLTDGVANVGTLTPLQAAEEAKKFAIKVYTIGLGTDEAARIPVGNGIFGTQYQLIPGGSIDYKTLKEISDFIRKYKTNVTKNKVKSTLVKKQRKVTHA
jgi:ribosomal protein S18